MPNLTLAHSANLPDAAGPHVLRAVNEAAAACGLFDEADIKTRLLPPGPHLVGTSDAPRGFLHLVVGMGPRGEADEKRLALALAAALERAVARPAGIEVQLCVEIQPVRLRAYVKRVLGP